jgi:hypothetical protein
MSDEEKKQDASCCWTCWKIIFITLALLIIGAVFGHVMTVRHYYHHHYWMSCGEDGMKACWQKHEGEHHGWWWKEKEEKEEHKPGVCPKSTKKKVCAAEPNKAVCPLMKKEREEKEEKEEKEKESGQQL